MAYRELNVFQKAWNWFFGKLLRRFPALWNLVDKIGPLRRRLNRAIINSAVKTTRSRPHPFSAMADYTSWASLTDKTYLGRHYPPVPQPADLPLPGRVRDLFVRPADGGAVCPKSTLLFPVFAQYLTDGFLRTNSKARDRTTSNHDIDLSPLYGLKKAHTDALRLKSDEFGSKGRLKFQLINGEMFPRYLFEDDGKTVRAEFIDPITGKPILDEPVHLNVDGHDPTRPVQNGATLQIFAVGGDRVNSTPQVAMMNTLMLREHNRIAGELEGRNPTWDDDRVFETARNIVIAIYIKMVVEEYINHISSICLPLRADPSVAWKAAWNRPNWMTVEFSLLYRWHTMIPNTITWASGPVPAVQMVQDNQFLTSVGLSEAFKLTCQTKANALGLHNTADFLLNTEGLAIDQGRNRQLAPYNVYRNEMGLKPAESFAEITSDPERQAALKDLYRSPDRVEFYVGLFAEDVNKNTPMPTLLGTMVALDAFSQALNNPILSEHVFNKATFTQWGLDEILKPQSIADLLARQAGKDGSPDPAIVMTRPDWRRQ